MASAPPFPVSDHCNGWRFINPPGWRHARGFSDLPKWWAQRLFLGQGSRWPGTASAPAKPELPSSVPPGQIAVTLIGHSTFLLQLAGLNILTDPIFSSRAGPFGWAGPKRVRPPALRLEELPRIDVVLVSHCHYDHLDLPTLRWLARERRPLIVTTLGNKAWLESHGISNSVELDWWQSHQARPDLSVTCTPAQHFAARSPWDRCKTLWGGFALQTAAGRIYFVGDSGYCGAFKEIGSRLGPFDLALIPIGSYEPRWFMEAVHCTPAEAVKIHRDVRARQGLAMHFGCFPLADDGLEQPIEDLRVARQAAGLTATDFAVPQIGRTVLYRLAGT